jgi:uncharacterized OB-fold protein
MSDVIPFRVLPAVTPETEHFWKGGADGHLHLQRCSDCGYWIHPALPRCPSCLGKNLAPQVASGRGTVHSWTVNYQQWIPGSNPYVIGLIELEEQEGLRLATNVVGCDPDDVHIGMAVEVLFEENGDIYLPLFRPARGAK